MRKNPEEIVRDGLDGRWILRTCTSWLERCANIPFVSNAFKLFKALRAFRRLFLKPAGPGKCYLGGLRGQKGDQKDFRGALLGILGAARVPLGRSLGALWGMWRRVAA